MPSAQIPHNEQQRLEALAQLDILYTPLEQRFDRITRTVKRLFDVPIAYMSLIDADKQWLKSAQGIECTTFNRDESVCAHTLLEEEYLVCEDLSKDQRFSDNPFVQGQDGLRFYAGFALKSRGQNIGTLCLIDTKSRHFSNQDLESLRDLASWAQTELNLTQLSDSQIRLISELTEAQRQAQTDSLTGLWNHNAIQDVLKRAHQRQLINRKPLSLLMVDLDHFKHVNDHYGHAIGDQVLRRCADSISQSLRPDDTVGRYGGEEFMVVLENCPVTQANKLAQRLLSHIRNIDLNDIAPGLSLTTSIGISGSEINQASSPQALMKEADSALYQAKDSGRDRIQVAPGNPSESGVC